MLLHASMLVQGTLLHEVGCQQQQGREQPVPGENGGTRQGFVACRNRKRQAYAQRWARCRRRHVCALMLPAGLGVCGHRVGTTSSILRMSRAASVASDSADVVTCGHTRGREKGQLMRG